MTTPPSPIRIYAAGKVLKNGWRKSIGIGQQICCDIPGFTSNCNEAEPNEIRILQTIETAIAPNVYYVGPFAIACDHGCYHGVHGCSRYPQDDPEDDFTWLPTPTADTPCLSEYQRLRHIQRAVYDNAKAQIEKCTHFFVWLDDPTAFGTISEIGYAAGLGKPIYLATPPNVDLRDLWFCQNFATMTLTTPTADTAWHTFLDEIQKPH